jgi:hypothetical protein
MSSHKMDRLCVKTLNMAIGCPAATKPCTTMAASLADGNWQAYLLYVQHATVAPALADYPLGNSDQEAQHYLLLDRQERRVSVAPVEEAQRVLHDQWPREDARGLEPGYPLGAAEDWQCIQAHIWRSCHGRSTCARSSPHA